MQMMMLDSDTDDDDSDPDGDHDGGSSTDSFFYERAFEAVEQLLDEAAAAGEWGAGCCRDSAIFSDREDGPTGDCLKSKPPPPPVSSSKTLRSKDFSSTFSQENVNWNLILKYRPVSAHQPCRRTQRSLAILDRVKSLEERTNCSSRSGSGTPPSSTSLENLKSISQRRSELKQAVVSGTVAKSEQDESETSSQHSTSTINTVVDSGGSSSLPCGGVRAASSPPIPTRSTAAHPLPKGWVKHIIGKLQGEAK